MTHRAHRARPAATTTHLLAGAAVLATALAPATARGQATGPPPVLEEAAPTRGLYVPGGVVAGDAEATAVETNPGQLGLVEMASTALVASYWDDAAAVDRDVAPEGRGVGLFFASPLLIRPLTLGFGFQWLRPTGPNDPESYSKLTLGGGVRLGPALGFGAVWEHLFRGRHAGLDSMSLGVGLHLTSFAALGLAVRDVTRPEPAVNDERLPREWDGELALRPLRTRRLELGVGLRALDGGDNVDVRWLPHGRLSVGLVRGLALFAEVEGLRARARYADDAGGGHAPDDFRASVGITATFDRSSVTAAGVGGWRRDDAGEDGAHTPGGSVALRQTFNRQPSLVSFPRYVARVKLAGLENDRAFLEALFALRRLGDDGRVGAVLLAIEQLDLGYGRIDELRAVVAEVSRRKPVFAWVTQPDTNEYYLASACGHIVMHPAGGLFLGGLATTVTFFAGAMEQLGVSVDLVRIAEFKGAMEPFVLREQSGPVRDNRNALLDDVSGRLLAGIAAGRAPRGLERARLPALVDQAMFTPAQAKDAALVDEVGDEQALEKFVQRALGRGWPVRDADFGRRDPGRWRPTRVAVILVDGAITDGKPQGFPPVQGTVAWSDPIVDALAAVRRDPSVRAVVLRVNSPGGSAFASDRIARELRRLREARKPVIVSMGDTAASGGYYVAAPSDAILAAPSTVTGSIGIYAFKADVSRLLEKLAVNTETSKRGLHADLYSPYRPWTPGERETVMARIDYHYRQFLRVVADGRKQRGINEQRADQLGKGHVYTGAQAQPLGLVDRLGSAADAVDEAARLGRVPTGAGGLPELVYLPHAPADPLATLLALRRLVSSEDGTSEAEAGGTWDAVAQFLRRQSRAAARLIAPLLLSRGNGIEARLPYEIEVR
jgi:protease IV